MIKVFELLHTKGHEVRGIQKSMTVAEAAKAFLERDGSSLLVYDNNKLAGIFTKNDLVRCCVRDKACWDQPVSAVMTPDLFTVPSDATLEDVFEEMVRRGLHHVPVMDGDRAVGMLTPTDVLLHQKGTLDFENQELMRYITGSY